MDVPELSARLVWHRALTVDKYSLLGPIAFELSSPPQTCPAQAIVPSEERTHTTRSLPPLPVEADAQLHQDRREGRQATGGEREVLLE